MAKITPTRVKKQVGLNPIAKLVARENIGVAVRQGDAEALANQLLRLAGDAALCEAMGARARVLLCERYDKRIAFRAWEELLGRL